MNKINNKIRKYRPYDTFVKKVDKLVDRANGKDVAITKIDKKKFINQKLTQDTIKAINYRIDGGDKIIPYLSGHTNNKIIVDKLNEIVSNTILIRYRL